MVQLKETAFNDLRMRRVALRQPAILKPEEACYREDGPKRSPRRHREVGMPSARHNVAGTSTIL